MRTLAIGLRAGRLTAGLQILRRKPRPGRSAAHCARLDTPVPETLDLGAESQFAFRLNAAVFEQYGYGLSRRAWRSPRSTDADQ
jgi:hypothetical protein